MKVLVELVESPCSQHVERAEVCVDCKQGVEIEVRLADLGAYGLRYLFYFDSLAAMWGIFRPVAPKQWERKQGHHHKGDQAARRPHMMCSIFGRRFTTILFGIRGDRDELIR